MIPTGASDWLLVGPAPVKITRLSAFPGSEPRSSRSSPRLTSDRLSFHSLLPLCRLGETPPMFPPRVCLSMPTTSRLTRTTTTTTNNNKVLVLRRSGSYFKVINTLKGSDRLSQCVTSGHPQTAVATAVALDPPCVPPLVPKHPR